MRTYFLETSLSNIEDKRPLNFSVCRVLTPLFKQIVQFSSVIEFVSILMFSLWSMVFNCSL